MADLNESDRAEAVKIVGANPITGIVDNFLEIDANGYIGARLYDASGTALDTNYGTAGVHTIRVASQIGNIAGAALFGSGTTTAQVLRVVLPTDQTAIPVTQSGVWNITNITGTISLPSGAASATNQVLQTTALQLIDNAVGSVAPGTAGTNSFLIGGIYSATLPTLTAGQQVAIQFDSSSRVIIAPLVNTSVVKAQLQDNSGNGINSVNNQLLVQHSMNTTMLNGAISVTSTASEAKVGVSRLVNRKAILITPTNGIIYFGSSAAVTIATGTPIFKNQSYSIAVSDNVPVYLIAVSTTDVRIVEGS